MYNISTPYSESILDSSPKAKSKKAWNEHVCCVCAQYLGLSLIRSPFLCVLGSGYLFTHLRQRGERLDMSCSVGLALLFIFIFIIVI